MVGWSGGDTKEKGLSGRECTTELHNPSNTDLQNSGLKMKSFLLMKMMCHSRFLESDY